MVFIRVDTVEHRELTIGRDTFHQLVWNHGASGPLLHLAHANGFCAGTYAPLCERLAQRFPVLATDARGHGSSRAQAHPEALVDWRPFTNDLINLFASLGQRVVAVGHSLGGVASMLAAIERPDLVQALVLLDPTIFPRSWSPWLAAYKGIGEGRFIPLAAKAARRQRVWPSLEVVAEVYRRKPAFRHWRDDFFAGYLGCGFRPAEDGVELRCDPAWEARIFATTPHQLWREIPRLRCPTLVLYGGRSVTFRRASAVRFARAVPQAQLHAWPHAGHFVPMESPDEVADATLAFVGALA